jgi:hypothetical protein
VTDIELKVIAQVLQVTCADLPDIEISDEKRPRLFRTRP